MARVKKMLEMDVPSGPRKHPLIKMERSLRKRGRITDDMDEATKKRMIDFHMCECLYESDSEIEGR
jgi:hypothetical protein